MADKTKAGPTPEELLALHEAKEARRAELKAKRDDERAKLEGETKEGAFKRIGTRRLNNALAEIAKMQSLANPDNYVYTQDQVNTIIKALENEVLKLQGKFENPKAPTGTGVSL